MNSWAVSFLTCFGVELSSFWLVRNRKRYFPLLSHSIGFWTSSVLIEYRFETWRVLFVCLIYDLLTAAAEINEMSFFPLKLIFNQINLRSRNSNEGFFYWWMESWVIFLLKMWKTSESSLSQLFLIISKLYYLSVVTSLWSIENHKIKFICRQANLIVLNSIQPNLNQIKTFRIWI